MLLGLAGARVVLLLKNSFKRFLICLQISVPTYFLPILIVVTETVVIGLINILFGNLVLVRKTRLLQCQIDQIVTIITRKVLPPFKITSTK